MGLILVLMVMSGLPLWPDRALWGPYPSSLAGALLIVILILLLLRVV